MRRQEVIYELAETEISFITSQRNVLTVLATALTTEEGSLRTDVPVVFSHLQSWLEEIVKLHLEISSRLSQLRLACVDGIILEFSRHLQPFVNRLDVYQPYLIRFEGITRIMDEMLLDPTSDLGEILRTQSLAPELGGLSLSSFLLKPVQRLMKLPLFFKVSFRLSLHAPSVVILTQLPLIATVQPYPTSTSRLHLDHATLQNDRYHHPRHVRC